MWTIPGAPERKFHQPEASPLKVTDGTVIEGYASLFGVKDQGGDVVQKGAYAASLKRAQAAGRGVKMLWQHDPTQPIGIWDEVREDATGLWVKGRILTEVEKGREAAALLQAGAIDGLSIGYKTVKAERDGKGQRLLSELELWEVSLVTFPMLPEARVAAKGDSLDADIFADLAQAFEEARLSLASASAAFHDQPEETRMTETKARAGEDLSPAHPGAEVKSAMAGFLNAFNGFQSEVKQSLQQNQDRLNKLERKTMTYARPALSTAAELDQPHKKAMAAYLRSGDDDGLRGLTLEGKAMSTAVNADGGFLLNPQMSEQINSMLASTTSLRALANVVQIDATSYDVIIDNSDPGSAWQSEIAVVSESSTPNINRISIKLNDLSAMPKISQRLLDDASFDVEGWIAQRIATRFIRAEASAFVNGTGVDQPKGILLPTKVANASWTWGNLGYIPTGAASDFAASNPIDCLVTLIYSLAADYRANATFVMNSKTAGAVRKIKDSTGRFMWNDSLAAGQPATLMGYRVVILEDMPDIAANSYPIAFGDFASGYTIAERPDLRILRDPFSAKPNVLFYASKRVGGDITDYAAIKLLKVAVS